MSTTTAKAFFFLNEEDTYSGPEPYFYDEQQFTWVKVLEDNWHILRDEMAPLIEGTEPMVLNSSNPPYLSNPEGWKNIYFYNFMWKYHDTCKRFPKTYQFLKSIPNLTFAELTVLEPGSSVLPHIGETNTTIRGQLGVKIPGQYPDLGIRVGNEERGWQEGKVVLFSDAHRHTVWNNTDKRRFVLVFDVMRDEFAQRKTWMCAQSLSALVIKGIDERIPVFKKMPQPLLKISHFFISLFWRAYLPIQRSVKFF